MENDLISLTATLFVLGLLSSIMIEVYIKWFPECVGTGSKNKIEAKPTNDDETGETHEMTQK